jgi:hypothetical protein
MNTVPVVTPTTNTMTLTVMEAIPVEETRQNHKHTGNGMQHAMFKRIDKRTETRAELLQLRLQR